MSLRMLPSPVAHLTEFWDGYNGTCQQTALAVTTAAARGFVATENYMVQIEHEMAAAGLVVSPNGSSTMIEGHQWLLDNHYSVNTWAAYNYYLAASVWKNVLWTHAGIRPIVLQVANGQALIDNNTKQRDESGLHYHFIAIVGMIDSQTYLCADGDNPGVTSHFQTYTLQTLVNAHPCAFLVLNMQRVAPPERPMLQIANVSNYFTQQADGSWKSKKTGFSIRGGVLQAFRTWPAEGTFFGFTEWGLPLSDEIIKSQNPYATIQHFERRSIAYDPKRVLDNPPGSIGPIYSLHV